MFGLGFDTASEVALLAMTAGATAGDLPIAAVLCLPLLFAAGMSLMDTADGVLMSKAYDWAYRNPLRKIFYNLVTTGLSVAFALVIGTIELLQVAIRLLDLSGPVSDLVANLDFGVLGYVIVALLLLAWGLSVAAWYRFHTAGSKATSNTRSTSQIAASAATTSEPPTNIARRYKPVSRSR